MPPLQSPASARRSTGDAARDQPIPRRLPSHCLLHRCKHRCLHHCAITPHQTDRRKAPFAGWVLTFPEREVMLALAAAEALSRIVAHSDTVAELRLARDTPATF